MTRPAIRIEDLHYAYPAPNPGAADVVALDGIDLSVESGEFVAVMGPTGAGKTTLCLALNGLVPQSTGGVFRGNVWIGDENTRVAPVSALATRVGIVFQEPESQLFAVTVEDEVAFGPENLGLPADEIEQRIEWALAAVGLSDLRRRSPAYLSGGQQQRLALAAVLAMQPAILVLDEPTAGLDPLGRRAVLDAVAGLRRQGLTVVMATQDADAATTLADRVAVLEAGRVVLRSTPAEIFAQAERLFALGVHVPQMAELSQRLGVNPAWLTVEQAFQALQCGGEPALTFDSGWHRGPELGRDNLGVAHSSPQTSRPAVAPCTLVPGPPERESGAGGRPRQSEDAGLGAQSASVSFEDVRYRYEGGVQALDGINLAIPAGEYVALIGANGSGKTTLAKHINGLLRPQSGRVLLAGADTRRKSPGELARQVGYVFQNPDHQIFAPTVHEEIAFGPHNLGLPRAEVGRRVEDALETFQLTPLAGLPPAALGAGQRRLVTLASVHAMRPSVLVLDEPTSGLDRALSARLLAWVSLLHRSGASVVFITHDMPLAALAPRCVVMAGGRVIMDAPTAAAFARPDELARAGITPPPIVELGRRLGMLETPLSVDDFCRILGGTQARSPWQEREVVAR